MADHGWTVESLARLVKQCRDCQRTYFRTRQPSALNESRDAERRLDRVLEEILDPPGPDLFDVADGEG